MVQIDLVSLKTKFLIKANYSANLNVLLDICGEEFGISM